MKIGYYPGCSLHGTAKEYDISTKLVCNELGIELEELPDWTCCGASSGHSVNKKLSQILSCSNIAIADKMGLDIVAPCASCFNRLKDGEKILKEDDKQRKELEGTLGFKYRGTKIYHLLDYVFSIAGVDAVKKRVKSPLNDLKVACYYGCLITRPNKVTECDFAEAPQKLDILMDAVGCKVYEWSYKTECCGAGLSLIRKEIVEHLVERLINSAKMTGASAIITACPLCQANLEMRQKNKFPILYFSEILSISFGIKEIDECLKKHMVSVTQLEGLPG